MNRFFVWVLLPALSGCGKSPHTAGDGGQASNDAIYGMTINSESNLPLCNDSLNGRLVYISDSKQFMTCDGFKWVPIDLRGGTGPVGNTGPAGAAGAAGSAATATKITTTLYCYGTISASNNQGLTLPAAGSITIYYWARVLSSGDVWASASVDHASSQASGSNYYASTQSGAATAAVSLVDDFVGAADSGFWSISVDRSTKIPTAVYQDADLATTNTRTWTFLSTACTLQSY